MAENPTTFEELIAEDPLTQRARELGVPDLNLDIVEKGKQKEEANSLLEDLALAVPSGVSGAVREVAETGAEVSEQLPSPLFGELGPILNLVTEGIDRLGIEEPDGMTGQFLENVIQFSATFLPITRALKGLQATGKVGNVAKAAVEGGLADVLAFDESEERLSNLIQSYPFLSNPVTEVLSAREGDSAAVGKLRQAVEGVGLGLAADGIIAGLRFMRRGKRAKAGEEGPQVQPEPAVGVEEGAIDPRTIQSAEEVDQAIKTQAPEPGPTLTQARTEVAERLASLPVEQATQTRSLALTELKFTPQLPQPGAGAKIPKKEARLQSRRADMVRNTSQHAISRMRDLASRQRKLVEAEGEVKAGLEAEVKGLTRELDQMVKSMGDNAREFGKRAPTKAAQEMDRLVKGVREARKEILGRQRDIARLSKQIEPFKRVKGRLGLEETKDLPLRELEAVADQMEKSNRRLRRLAQVDLDNATNNLDFLKQVAVHLNLLDRVAPASSNSGLRLQALATPTPEQARALEDLLRTGYDIKAGELAKAIQGQESLEGVQGALIHLHRALGKLGNFVNPGAGSNQPPAPAQQVGKGLDPDPGLGRLERGPPFDRSILEAPRESRGLADAIQRSLAETYVMGLFSALRTQVINVAGNSSTLLFAPMTRLTGGLPGEAAAMTFGMMEGFRDALVLAATTARTGKESFVPTAKIDFDKGVATRAQEFGLTNSSALGNAINWLGFTITLPGRGLLTMDQFFKAVNFRAELSAQAYRRAAERGLKGEEFAREVDRLKSQPPEDLVNVAKEFATYQTFTKQLESQFAKTSMEYLDRFPILRVIAPVIRTPANILKYTTHHSPLGLIAPSIWNEMRAGGARKQAAWGKIGLGTLMMSLGLVLHKNGVITGDGPSDPGEAGHWRNAGFRDNSIWLGDRWVQYRGIEPFGNFFQLAAKVGEVVDMFGPESEESKFAAALGVAQVGTSMISEEWLFTVGDTLRVMLEKNPDKRAAMGERVVENIGRSAVPFSAALRSVQQQMDDTIPQTMSWMDNLLAGVPGASGDLPRRVNFWGEPRRYADRLGPNWASPVIQSIPDPDPIEEELARMGSGIRVPWRQVEGVELEEDEFQRLLEIRGKEVIGPDGNMKETLNRLIQSPDYLALDDETRELVIRDVINGFTRAARGMMLQESPDLRARVRESKLGAGEEGGSGSGVPSFEVP